MAVDQSRSMNVDFAQGSVDNTYIQLTPNRGNVENPPIDRLDWPNYRQAERHVDPPFLEAHLQHALRPVERKVRPGTDVSRF